MGVPITVARFYNATRTSVAEVEAFLRPSLQRFCDQHNYILSIRSKELTSVSEKFEMGRFRSLSAIDDLLAALVVIPTVSHEPGVVEFLREILVPVDEKLRNRTQKAPDTFRFDASRFVGRMRPQEGLQYQLGTTRMLCEVQIRTAFEHAWMVVTHDLVYKSDSTDWRKHRLAAQLKASVEQIELLIGTFDASAAALPVSAHPETDAKTRIVDTFKEWATIGLIPAELLPGSWSRFAENVYALVASYRRNRFAVPAGVDELLDAIGNGLRSGAMQPPLSGSLFQMVIAAVAHGRVRDGSIGQYQIVPSQELSDLYGVTEIPSTVELDWEI
jgi:hypothetical protein